MWNGAQEELDENLILRMLRDFNLPIPDQDFLAQFGPMDSPQQVAIFISRCRKLPGEQSPRE